MNEWKRNPSGDPQHGNYSRSSSCNVLLFWGSFLATTLLFQFGLLKVGRQQCLFGRCSCFRCCWMGLYHVFLVVVVVVVLVAAIQTIFIQWWVVFLHVFFHGRDQGWFGIPPFGIIRLGQ